MSSWNLSCKFKGTCASLGNCTCGISTNSALHCNCGPPQFSTLSNCAHCLDDEGLSVHDAGLPTTLSKNWNCGVSTGFCTVCVDTCRCTPAGLPTTCPSSGTVESHRSIAHGYLSLFTTKDHDTVDDLSLRHLHDVDELHLRHLHCDLSQDCEDLSLHDHRTKRNREPPRALSRPPPPPGPAPPPPPRLRLHPGECRRTQ